MKLFKEVTAKAAGIFLVMVVVCGVLYTLLMTGVGQLFFKDKANGSIIEVNGVKYGSELIGQRFTKPEHLWGRIVLPDTGSFTDSEGNPAVYAWASNKTPAGEELEGIIAERVAAIKESNPDAATESIPVELVTVSGSGLDPHISPAAAEYQVPRIAKERGISEDEVRTVIDRYTDGKLFGILGEKTVNVLEVNLALDGILQE